MRLVPWRRKEERYINPADLGWFNYQGNFYYPQPSFTLNQSREEIDPSFVGYVQQVYQANGVVYACMAVRQALFSEARFQFRQIRNGRPGDLFGSQELAVLERPQPNATTGDLLARAIQDVDLAGNFYGTRRNNRIYRMRPDWVTIVLGSQIAAADVDALPAEQLDVEVAGYLFHPGGRYSGKAPVALLPEEVAHFAPKPDPVANYRGMSWLTSVLREVQADGAATLHKLKFFENGATPNLAIKLDPSVRKDAFDEWVRVFRESHEGAANAYKTLILGGGADFTPVGADMQQVSFKEVQGAGETRIAAAAEVPPVIVGLSEGLEAATYSNYQLAMRRFADLTMRPLWRNVASSFSNLVTVPANAELWYDDRDVPALAENEKDRAEIDQVKSQTIKALIDAGYDPKSVVAAVEAGDFTRLAHSGLYSVQLQPPGSQLPPANGSGTPPAADPPANGSGSRELVALT